MESYNSRKVLNNSARFNNGDISFTSNCFVKISDDKFIKVEEITYGCKILTKDGYKYVNHIVKIPYKGEIFCLGNIGFSLECPCIIDDNFGISKESFSEIKQYNEYLFNLILETPSLFYLYNENFTQISVPSLGYVFSDKVQINNYFLTSSFIEYIKSNFTSFEITLNPDRFIYDEEENKIINIKDEDNKCIILTKISNCGSYLLTKIKENLNLLPTTKPEENKINTEIFDSLYLLEEGKYIDLSKTQVTKIHSTRKITKITVIYDLPDDNKV